MSEQKFPFAKEMEELLQKSMEANKIFMSESSKFMSRLSNQAATKENIFKTDIVSDAFTAYAKLGIQHVKNMIDLGVSLVQQKDTGSAPQENNDTATTPAFELRGSGVAGSSIMLQFVLDNVKKEEVLCELIHTDYSSRQNAATITHNIPTSFTPQAFQLAPATSQTVDITIQLPRQLPAGEYCSHVQVKGFEPAFFAIYITITTPSSKAAAHGSKNK
jgi:stress-induced morphogen